MASKDGDLLLNTRMAADTSNSNVVQAVRKKPLIIKCDGVLNICFGLPLSAFRDDIGKKSMHARLAPSSVFRRTTSLSSQTLF